MKNIRITELFTYPLKSAEGIKLEKVRVTPSGFEFDRHFGVINSKNEMLTARENTMLLHISVTIEGNIITLKNTKNEFFSFDLTTSNSLNKTIEVSLFNKTTHGFEISKEADEWISKTLNEDCKLIRINSEKPRKVDFQNIANTIAFSDAFPIHLITEASLQEINSKLKNPITDNRYRPNIIITGTKPFEEENWKSITIGSCTFDIITPTERCSLITINPLSLDKDKQQEPLRTLAKNRRGSKKVTFGMYLIPTKTGIIQKSDTIKVM